MKKVKFIFIILLFSSCSYSTFYLQSGSKTYEKTNPKDIKLYVSKPEKHFLVIGSIVADADGGIEKSRLLLKDKAAELGADAVINVNIYKYTSYDNRMGVNGVAVKFVD